MVSSWERSFFFWIQNRLLVPYGDNAILKEPIQVQFATLTHILCNSDGSKMGTPRVENASIHPPFRGDEFANSRLIRAAIVLWRRKWSSVWFFFFAIKYRAPLRLMMTYFGLISILTTKVIKAPELWASAEQFDSAWFSSTCVRYMRF